MSNLFSKLGISGILSRLRTPKPIVPYVKSSSNPLVWIDCEMTGLDPDTESIMSICCFVTDAQLKLLDEKGFDVIIHHNRSRLEQMSAWCITTHGENGLTEACIASTTTHEKAATDLLAYITKYVPEPGRGLLAGNTVHHDKIFLSKGPYRTVTEHLSYRILDVSSINEAVKRWSPTPVLSQVPMKKHTHQARDDILESIAEAKYYRDQIFLRC